MPTVETLTLVIGEVERVVAQKKRQRGQARVRRNKFPALKNYVSPAYSILQHIISDIFRMKQHKIRHLQ